MNEALLKAGYSSEEEYLQDLAKQAPRDTGKSYPRDAIQHEKKAPDFSKGTRQQRRKAERIEKKSTQIEKIFRRERKHNSILSFPFLECKELIRN
ncbi:MAG: hypothetical protein WC656_01495 [Sulfurimonas sp.]|jgi:hypothetical protein